ncbi:MAG: YceI family protein [Planctomycetota bacterium]
MSHRWTLGWVVVLIAAVGVAIGGESRAATSDTGEKLAVFVQPGDGDVAGGFADAAMPEVQAIADELGVEVVTIDVGEAGAPDGVALTPSMVYINHRGRYPYLGRFTTTDRLRNHIRTARFGGGAEDVRTNLDGVPRRTIGRAVVGTPIKVTPWVGPGVDAVMNAEKGRVEGMPSPADLSQVDDSPIAAMHMSPITMYRNGIYAALGKPAHGDDAEPMDRLFYADFYPYLDDDGTLYVSTALFSQFHCHEPVFVSETPASGNWTQTEQVFAEAAAGLAEEIDRQLSNPENGDGFDAIAVGAATPAWDDLGLSLPPKPEGPDIDVADLEFVREWTVDQEAVNRRPVVQFRFPEPIVGYAGEAQQLTGGVTLGEGLTLADASGEFVVPVKSVTMGEPDLDSYIHSGMLDASAHPNASFVFDSIEVPDGATPAFGQVIPGKLIGTFTMKNKAIPLSVPVSIEAFAGEDGKPRLAFVGTWVLGPLNTEFGIDDAPPGPEEAASRLSFDCYIVLEPAE